MKTNAERPNKVPKGKGSAMSPELKARVQKVLAIFSEALHADDWPLEAPSPDGKHSWFQLLEKLDRTKDPALLLPLLNVPDHVRPHFEDMLARRYRLHYRPHQGKTLPSYLPMSLTAADVELGAWLVQHLKVKGLTEQETEKVKQFIIDVKAALQAKGLTEQETKNSNSSSLVHRHSRQGRRKA